MASAPNIFCATGLPALSRMVAKSGINPVNQNNRDTVAYVETANTSQISGLRGCGHSHIVLGYGSSQYASHGRPRCKIGNIPAQATANNVIASEKRLIEVLQSCLSSNKIAEIRVPACPIPIHHTKFTMANPHATGITIPHTPTPLANSHVTATINRFTSTNAIANPMKIWRGVLTKGMNTTPPIFVVTVAKSWPGPMTLSGPGSNVATRSSSTIRPFPSTLPDVRIWIPQPRQICGARMCVELFEQAVIALLALAPRYLAIGIVYVAEYDGVRRTGLLAGSDNFAV